eukprot:5479881-Lingulodinium_polyedra.AAC.1
MANATNCRTIHRTSAGRQLNDAAAVAVVPKIGTTGCPPSGYKQCRARDSTLRDCERHYGC